MNTVQGWLDRYFGPVWEGLKAGLREPVVWFAISLALAINVLANWNGWHW